VIDEIEDILAKKTEYPKFGLPQDLLQDMDRILGGKEPPREKKPSWWERIKAHWPTPEETQRLREETLYPGQRFEHLAGEIELGHPIPQDDIDYIDRYLARQNLRPPGFTLEQWLQQPESIRRGYNYAVMGMIIFGVLSPILAHSSFGPMAKRALLKVYRGKLPERIPSPKPRMVKEPALVKPPVRITAPTKIVETAIEQLKQSVAQVKIVKTEPFRGKLEGAIYKAIERAVPGIKKARVEAGIRALIDRHLIGAPIEVSPRFAKATIDSVFNDFPRMLEQARVYGEISPALFRREVVTPEEEIVEREMAKPLVPLEEYIGPEVAPKVPAEAVEGELQGMFSELIEAEPGKRIRTETGEWMAQPSTYPQWMRDYKISKKDALEAYRTKKGITWQRIQDVARDRVEYGYVSPALGRIPPYMEQEINMGGGPALGMGIELTKKELFTEPKEKNPLGKAVDRVTGWFSVYSRVKKENPEAYVMFRHFKGGQEVAWINANQVNRGIWGKISLKDATAIQRYRQIEEVTLESLPERLRPIALRLDAEIESRKEALIARRKMEVGWPESYINQLNREREKLTNEIPLLKLKKAIVKRQDRIEEIDELVEVLQHRRFFPGMYQQTSETQPQIIKLLPEGRWRSSQLRSKWRKGKFIPDIDTAVKWGLHPADPRAAMLDYLYWDELEKNKWVLFQGIKDDANLALLERNAPEWWNTVAIKELKGYKVNPLITEILEEFAASGTISPMNLPNAYMKLARYGKIASFYNPIIMGGIYDPQQGYLAAGIPVLNPIRYTKALIGNLKQDEFYKQCAAADLYPKPVDLGPQRNMDDLVLSAAKQMDESCSDFTRFVEKATDGKWNFKGGENTKNMIKALSGLYSAEWNMTWTLDATSRRVTVEVLMARGWKFEDAVERARFYHADYGDIPSATRRFLNQAMWTPSYQISMAKVYGNLARHPIKEKGPLTRLIAFWLLAGTGAAILGYRWQEGYRFVKETERGEEVITGSGPLFFLHKYLARNPVQSAYYQSAIPIHIVWSLARNRDWKGDRIYEETDSKEMQLAKGAGYIIRTYFRPLEAMARMTNQDEDLLNRLLAIPAVSKYTRLPRREYMKYLLGEETAEYRSWVRRHPEAPPYEREKRAKVMRREMDKILAGPKQEIWQKMPVDIINWVLGRVHSK